MPCNYLVVHFSAPAAFQRLTEAYYTRTTKHRTMCVVGKPDFPCIPKPGVVATAMNARAHVVSPCIQIGSARRPGGPRPQVGRLSGSSHCVTVSSPSSDRPISQSADTPKVWQMCTMVDALGSGVLPDSSFCHIAVFIPSFSAIAG